MTQRWLAAAALVSAFTISFACSAAERVKVGFISTLSGPNSGIGTDILEGFNLFLKLSGGKLGGLQAELITADDQFNPDSGRQMADRLIKRDRVDFLTGIVFSNIMLAVAPVITETKTPYISANAGPSQLAGEGCSRYFVSAAWQNDEVHAAAGKMATDKGFKNVLLVAPNYAAGNDALAGFKSQYKGHVAEELRTKLGQLDYAAELAQIRAAKPEAIYMFLPGGMGINFVKQFVAAGLSKDTTIIAPGFAADEDIIRAVGEPMLGIFNTSHWAHDLDNEANKKFVSAYEREYGRLPSVFASQGYDAAQLIDAAVHDVKGKIEDKQAVLRALHAAHFKSPRGEFKMNHNNFPIQSYYLRVIGRDAKGRVTNKVLGTVLTNRGDAYAAKCSLKW